MVDLELHTSLHFMQKHFFQWFVICRWLEQHFCFNKSFLRNKIYQDLVFDFQIAKTANKKFFFFFLNSDNF